jgi:hypothetical protein
MRMDRKIYVRPESYYVTIGRLMDADQPVDLGLGSGEADPVNAQAKPMDSDDFSFEENDIQWSDTVIDWKNVRFKL